MLHSPPLRYCVPVLHQLPKTTKSPANPDPEEKPGQTLPVTIKILAIGNSFSADAVEQELYGLFEAAGQKVIIGNLYIGGCPLEKHAANAASDAAAYSYRKISGGAYVCSPT